MLSTQKFLKVVELLLFSYAFVPFVSANGCDINLSSDVPNFSPVYLFSEDGSGNYQLFKPNGQITTIPLGSKLFLICTGSASNVISSLSVKSLELTCSNGNVLKGSGNTQYNLNQLVCSSIPSSSLKTSSEKCSNNNGYIFEAGFDYGTNKFAPLFTICYDNVTEHTFYTRSILNGKSINYSIQESTRRAFSASGMKLTTTATNTAYTINNQISKFEQLFGSSQPYITSTSFMARGHMTPDADMIFAYEQLATYYYANAAPEFQVVNAGNWIRVENLARSLSSTYDDDLEIYNGLMGQLQLPHPSNPSNKVDIILDSNNKIKAPKYYIKVIKHAATDSAVVMITLNNPFATQSDVDEFCTNVCEEAGFTDSNYADLSKGYTFCCDLNDFKLHYNDFPSDLTASNLLYRNPSSLVEIAPFASYISEEPEVSALASLKGCRVTLPKDIPSNSPVYLYAKDKLSDYGLFKPEGEVTTLPLGSKLLLNCPSNGVIEGLKDSALELTCSGVDTFKDNSNTQHSLNLLKCSKGPVSSLKLTSQKCSNDKGYIFEAGFDFQEQNFATLFSICYDNNTEHTYYTHNTINGKAINYSIQESTRKAFSAAGMKLTTTATNNFYTVKNQINKFAQLFGNKQTYIDSTSFLARGHLTPDADMIFAYEQLATYYYANAAPEFQVVNSGNWIRVENLARSLAASYNDDLDIYNGLLGQLELPHPTKTKSKLLIGLDDNENVIAPQYYIKVIQHKPSNAAVVMITLNNPFATSKDIDEFCPNVCEKAGLNNSYFSDLSRGYTFCCELNEFVKHYKDFPKDLKASKLLTARS